MTRNRRIPSILVLIAIFGITSSCAPANPEGERGNRAALQQDAVVESSEGANSIAAKKINSNYVPQSCKDVPITCGLGVAGSVGVFVSALNVLSCARGAAVGNVTLPVGILSCFDLKSGALDLSCIMQNATPSAACAIVGCVLPTSPIALACAAGSHGANAMYCMAQIALCENEKDVGRAIAPSQCSKKYVSVRACNGISPRNGGEIIQECNKVLSATHRIQPGTADFSNCSVNCVNLTLREREVNCPGHPKIN